MISKTTVTLFKWLIKLAGFIKIMPYKWTYADELKYEHKKNSPSYLIWRSLAGFNIFARLVFISITTYRVGFFFQDAERFVALFFLAAETISALVQIAVYTNPSRFSMTATAALTFNQLQGEKIRQIWSNALIW